MENEEMIQSDISEEIEDGSGEQLTLPEMPQETESKNVFRRYVKDDPRRKMLARHKLWLETIQHEYPMPYVPYKIGVYIRYYNQTKHDNYIEKHIAQFTDDIALCPNWTLVDFYIDKGMNAPRMENAKEWCRLLNDCLAGKIDLIVTQKVSNVSNDPDELAFLAKLLAKQNHPIGIYFISEDIFTLASYYRADYNDADMLPLGSAALPDDELDRMLLGYNGLNSPDAGTGDTTQNGDVYHA